MSKTTTIRVSREIYNQVKTLALQQNKNMQDIIEHAVTEYKKKKFYNDLNEAYAKLKSNPNDWQLELEERNEWDSLLADGLEKEDEY